MKTGKFLKRFFDIIVSTAGLLLSLPLWLIIPLFIYIEDGRPVFFSDHRVSRHRKVYKHFKFRSMLRKVEQETGPVWSKQHDCRVTRIGGFLRATAMESCRNFGIY
ncbi:MAG: hypothetical protein AUJ89_04235 [Candidatus Omnitrophica bacterium CG1_02_43_210]|nr:MAG: hypothetical protein AUJ89_04235 [Candidatus Omnitrophica bacterium CG1_02_43_210]